MGIIQDLYPTAEIKENVYPDLERAISNQLAKHNYQKPKMFVTKIFQLIETIMVRHGLMVVGTAQTGKTVLIKTLARALGQLQDEGSQDFQHKNVVEYRMNPKSVSL